MRLAQMSHSLYETTLNSFGGDSAQRYLAEMYTLGKLRFPSLLVLQCLQVMWGLVNTGLARALLAQVCFTHSLCLFYLRVEFSCLCLSERVSPEGQAFLDLLPITPLPAAAS